MSAAVLRLDELPPLRVPAPFFVTAPAFGMLLGLLLLGEGDLGLAARWTPTVLAGTHLLTLGFLAMVMVGALFQVVPVLGGRALPGTRWLAPFVHASLTGGTLCLAHGLHHGTRPWLIAAIVLLAAAFGAFVPALLVRVLAVGRGGPALQPIRAAGLSLLATVLLGLLFAASIAWPGLGFAHRTWTDVHAAIGFGGWVLLLIAGVGSQVVPMFHVTPAFPPRLLRWLGPGVLAALALLALRTTWATAAGGAMLAGAAAAFGLATLALLHRRKRRRPEPVVRAWRLAMAVLLLCALLGLKVACAPELRVPGLPAHQEGMLLAVLFAHGVAVTVVLGMLGKIVPFLAFTHLQRRCLQAPAAIPLLPPMNAVVTDRAASVQWSAHALAVAALAGAVVVPAFGRVAGALVVADFAVCLHNVARGLWRYRQASRAIAAVEA